MQYICHRRYKQTGASGKKYNFPYGTTLDSIGKFIAYNNEAVCAVTSEDAHQFFARNDDGRGLERGALTYAIAYRPRGLGFRFTDWDRTMLEHEYPQFLKNTEFILFNHDFFDAEISVLEEIANKLRIRKE